MSLRGCAFRKSPLRILGAVSTLLLPGLGQVEHLAAQEQESSVQPLEPVVFELENGMRFLLVDRPGAPMTAAVWVVRAGSSDDPGNATGTAHLLEHLFFRGSRTIGLRGGPLEEEQLMSREEELYRKRAAPDPEPFESFDRKRKEIAHKLRRLEVKGEFARIYTEHDAIGLNALTRKDLTTFWLSLPSSKVELWFWMESDRLRDAVLRGFYEEIPVVEQERRQRIDAVPGGPEREQFNERFWRDHPYAWPAIGRAEDLYRLHRSTTRGFVDRFYTADRLTAVLVGDLDAVQIRSFAQRYFGDLPSKALEPEVELPIRGDPLGSADQQVPASLDLTCRCRTRVELRFHTVPFDHDDAVALDLLSALLAGRSGRLHRELTLDSESVFSAVSTHTPLRRAGSFSIEVEGKDGVDPVTLERQAMALVERLLTGQLLEREVERARNQVVTRSARQVKTALSLALRLGVYDALGDWRRVYDLPERVGAIDAVALQEVARRYLDPEKVSVLRLERGSP